VRADYLDYATGQNLKGLDATEALTGLLRRLRGRPATTQDLEQVQQRSAAASPSLPEDIVSADAALGDFELLGELGRGGMGIVYRARQRSLRRIVALKVLPPSLAADATLAQRFRREIAALGRCAHPNVVGILGSGVEHDRADYAMELIDGADLGKVGKTLAAWQKEGSALLSHRVAEAAAQNTDQSIETSSSPG
jgi:serine/threonine protein kinase